MKIFGIGLSRTGTTSLNRALNLLGFKSVHGPCDPVTMAQYRAGFYQLSILDQYDAITDIPICTFFPQMDAIYPGSKFILTVRNVEDWLGSIENHFRNTPLTDWKQFIRACTYGSILFSCDRYRYVYNRHCDYVKQYFVDRGQDLLVIDICSQPSWAPICQFLGKPIPDKPFPWLNSRSKRPI